MFAPVEPELAAPPAMGLIASARVINDDTRWQNGIAWQSERCPQARTMQQCADGSGFSELIGDGGNGPVYYMPVPYRVEDVCATRSGAPARDTSRVRRQAVAVRSYMMARELELGLATREDPYDLPFGGSQSNAYLASPDADVLDSGDAWTVQAGLGRLEEAARDGALGQDVFLHVPLRLISSLGDAVVREGNLLVTRTGARVVADAGYSGTGPLVPSTSEVQTVTITGGPTGGVFTLTFDGEETGDIAYNATGPVGVQSALNALPNLDGVTVTGPASGPYVVTFPASMGDVPTMTDDDTGLTGGAAPAVTVTVTTPGTDDSATAGLWMYATGPVRVRFTEPNIDQQVDHRGNRVINTAEVLFAAYFDPCNLHALAVVDPAPTP